ncbi:MAG: hypothetical protein H6974_12390 [Gammaproteobacteria bacterium]|nr:hypothetical protein [Gammaproteobacteria bacterium]
MTALALTPINGEPRIHDLLLAERLGFSQTLDIRKIIKRHEAKLLKFGVLATVAKTSGDQGGRPTTEFYLNQKQAIFICMKSETEKALDVQVEIVHVFDAYLNGRSNPEPQPRSIRSRDDLSFTCRDANGNLINWSVPHNPGSLWSDSFETGQHYFNELLELAKHHRSEAYDALRFALIEGAAPIWHQRGWGIECGFAEALADAVFSSPSLPAKRSLRP